MAKKTSSTSSGSIFDIINSVDNGCELIEQSAGAQINDYISTGSLILNACMTGSLFKGIPAGRVVTLAGDPGAGKSFLALSACREAQKNGYVPIYLDSEGAQDIQTVSRLGIDIKKFMIKQVNTITEVSSFILNLCSKLETIPEENRDKIIIVLDSLGNLTSTKEADDIKELTGKRDMTKQQEVKALFRVCATPLAKLHIPFIVVSHTYSSMSFIPTAVVSGGCLVPDEEVITSDGIKCIKDIKVGDKVLTVDGTYQDVLETFKFNKNTIKLEFDNGETIECSEDHKFLVENNYTLNKSWKKAKDLNENDFILSYVYSGN